VDGTVDPHYWLAPANAKAIARTVASELEGLVPARRSDIQSALTRYLGQLDAVEAEIRGILADLPTRRIATFHDAFGYFAEAFGLEVAAVFEPDPGREPSPRFVAEFQRKVRAAGVHTLFAEPQLSLDPLRPLARDLGVTLSVLDPLGGVSGRDTYLELLRFNARQVAAAVRGRTS
jgi:ABC-type Zn uptake system ZnuABC Zn-binding protein ZnuA